MRLRTRWVDIRPEAAFELCGAGGSEAAVLAWVFFVGRHTPYCLQPGCFGRTPS